MAVAHMAHVAGELQNRLRDAVADAPDDGDGGRRQREERAEHEDAEPAYDMVHVAQRAFAHFADGMIGRVRRAQHFVDRHHDGQFPAGDGDRRVEDVHVLMANGAFDVAALVGVHRLQHRLRVRAQEVLGADNALGQPAGGDDVAAAVEQHRVAARTIFGV